MSTDHIEVMRLLDYSRGRLGPRRARKVRQHCMGCEDCGGQLAAVLLLREGTENVRPAAPGRRYVAAAAAAIILLVTVVFWSQGSLVGRARSFVEGLRGDVAAVDADVGPRQASLEYVLDPMIWALERRAGDVTMASTANLDRDLASALDSLRTGDAASATRILAVYEVGVDRAVDIAAGTAQLLGGDAPAAEQRLRSALAGVQLTDPATPIEFRGAAVLLAEALSQQGDPAAAVRMLEEVVAGGDPDSGPDRATRAARARIEELPSPAER